MRKIKNYFFGRKESNEVDEDTLQMIKDLEQLDINEQEQSQQQQQEVDNNQYDDDSVIAEQFLQFLSYKLEHAPHN